MMITGTMNKMAKIMMMMTNITVMMIVMMTMNKLLMFIMIIVMTPIIMVKMTVMMNMIPNNINEVMLMTMVHSYRNN